MLKKKKIPKESALQSVKMAALVPKLYQLCDFRLPLNLSQTAPWDQASHLPHKNSKKFPYRLEGKLYVKPLAWCMNDTRHETDG